MSGPDPTDLGDRIAKAQAKREEKANRAERQRKDSINKPASMALRYSSELVAAVVVGVGLGLLIDHFANSSPWGLLVMMGFGMAAACETLCGQRNRCPKMHKKRRKRPNRQTRRPAEPALPRFPSGSSPALGHPTNHFACALRR